MKLSSPYRRKHSRIEIIPLIDIMFFLLASFMMVSLNLDRTQNIRVDLPTATQTEDRGTLHGIMADVYEVIRGAGVQKVAFAVAGQEPRP